MKVQATASEMSCRASELANDTLPAPLYPQKKAMKELPKEQHLPFSPWVAFSPIYSAILENTMVIK